MIIGQNNVGKSNIVNFLNDQYAYFVGKAKNQQNFGRNQQENPFKDIDHHISNARAQHRVSFPLFEEDIDSYINQKFPDERQHAVHRQLARRVLCSECFMHDGAIWFTNKAGSPNGTFELEVNADDFFQELNEREWQHLWNGLTRQAGGGLRQHWVPESLKALAYLPDSVVV